MRVMRSDVLTPDTSVVKRGSRCNILSLNKYTLCPLCRQKLALFLDKGVHVFDIRRCVRDIVVGDIVDLVEFRPCWSRG